MSLFKRSPKYNIKIKKKSWKDVTLKDFYKLQEIIANDELNDLEKSVEIIAILAEENVEIIYAIPKPIFDTLAKDTSFILEDVEKSLNRPKNIKIKDTVYTLNYSPQQFCVAQYLDLDSYLKHGIKYEELLSVMLIPKDHKYGENYDLNELIEEIKENVSYYDAKLIVNFWLGYVNKSLKTILLYLQYTIAQMTEEETDKQIKQKLMEVQEMIRSTVGLHS